MKRVASVPVFAIGIVLSLVSCHDSNNSDNPVSESSPTADSFDSAIANDWFDLLRDLVRENSLSPPVASRLYGFAGITLYEAVVPGMKGFRSLAGTLIELDALPKPAANQRYDWRAVANAALARVAKGLLEGDASPESLAAIADLEGRFAPNMAKDLKERSAAYGRSLADALLAWGARDGYTELKNCDYTPPVGEGLWVPTPPAYKPALQPCWGDIRPFVLDSSAICDPGPPTPYSEDPGSVFYAEAKEVYDTVEGLTDEQMAIALFWSDDPGATGTPPGHWMSIVKQVVEQYGFKLDVAAEAYLRAGIAVHEAFIACWRTKYIYNLVRPVTYAQEVLGHSDWLPALVTPPFPEYTSGHSIQSGAVAEVLTDLFDDLPFEDDTHHDRGVPARHFASFHEAAEEAAISRLYGGIHYRLACMVGVNQGVCLAREIVNRLSLAREP
ncbi:MAG: vanadium-dependent haloperoxidase [Planctomycetota bacterium]